MAGLARPRADGHGATGGAATQKRKKPFEVPAASTGCDAHDAQAGGMRMELLGNRQVLEFMSAGKLAIDGFDPARLDLVSYLPLLRPRDATRMLPAGHVLRLVSDETFRLNPEVVGMVFPTAETVGDNFVLLHGGIVHPLFSGRLHLAVMNVGDRAAEWHTSAHPARIVFFDLPYEPHRFGKEEAGAKVRAEVIRARTSRIEEELAKEGPTLGHE
ncbi:MAG: dCTP deaminase/dUTPase family protein [Thermoplasmatota archaeon]